MHQHRMRGTTHMIALGWVLLLGMMVWFASEWLARESNPNRNMTVVAGASELGIAGCTRARADALTRRALLRRWRN